LNKNVKDKINAKIGCAHFWFPCWLAIKLGFDGLCLSFERLPCPVRRLFNRYWN